MAIAKVLVRSNMTRDDAGKEGKLLDSKKGSNGTCTNTLSNVANEDDREMLGAMKAELVEDAMILLAGEIAAPSYAILCSSPSRYFRSIMLVNEVDQGC